MRWMGAFMALLAVCCAGRAPETMQAAPPRDLDLLSGAVAVACEEVWYALASFEPGVVSVERAGSDQGTWLVEEVLARGLLDRGWGVGRSGTRTAADSSATDDLLTLEYRMIGMRVRYQSSGKGLWRTSRVGRHAEVELAFRLEDEECGRLLWVGRGTGENRDTVPTSALPRLAHPEFSPPADDWPQSRPWVVEAAVATGLIGLLLAVFYAGTV